MFKYEVREKKNERTVSTALAALLRGEATSFSTLPMLVCVVKRHFFYKREQT
jgi:hypothetical protein